MKHQYVGDINDYRKYALLRALSVGGQNRIGVCWMLTPDDGGKDGRKLEYLAKPQNYRAYDPHLFDLLARVAAEPGSRRLDDIENSGLLDATFFNATLPQNIHERAAYVAECQELFEGVDLVFFDPDNGLPPPSVRKGQPDSSKYLYPDEAAAFYRAGKPLLIYQHRRQGQTWNALIASKSAQLHAIIPDAAYWVFWRESVAFFLAVHPASPARLAVAAMQACGRWEHSFITGTALAPASLAAQ